jgi:hypothetical protein
MPTYAFKCTRCGRIVDQFMSLGEYVRNPPTFVCCADVMERHIDSAPGLGLVGERHYEGLRAQDGTPIDTRAKHREYMRRNNLTTIDDYAQTWKREAEVREARLAGHDPSRKLDVAEAIAKLEG